MKSIGAVLLGILLALGIGLLEIFGIVAPIFDAFFGLQLTATAVPAVIIAGAAAFAFYFGGMLASYKAPSRRRLHGVMVGVTSFAISPLVNLGASAVSAGAADPFVNLRTPEALLFTCVLFVVVLAASYVGGRRGETLYAHNQAFIRRQKRRQRLKENP